MNGANGTAANLPSPRAALSATVLHGILYVIGGVNGGGAVDRVDIFNFSNSSWSVGPTLQHPRLEPAVAAIDGRIFVVGGATTNGASPPSVTPLGSTEMYDPATCTNTSAQCWLADAQIPVPRVYGKIVAVATTELHREPPSHIASTVRASSVWE